MSTVETSSSQRPESDAQTSRTIHINEEKSRTKKNKSIPVQCQPGPYYPFTVKQFRRKKRSCQASWFKKFSWLHYSKKKKKDSVFCILCISHKGKLTTEHNIEEAYITKGFNNWRKTLEAFVDYQQSKAHRARLDKESHLEPGQHTYMHNDIQNELIELITMQVLAKKLESILSSKFFGVIADEYSDISNRELLSMCFRWLKDLRVHEGIKGDTIVTAIKDSLIRMQLSLNDLRAQAFDRASNMFGKNTGVSAQIAAEQPKALSTHCQAHSLNLGIKTTTTNSKQMKDLMGTVTEIISLVKYSPEKENLLGNTKDLIHFDSVHTDDEIEVAPILDKLSATRWTVRENKCVQKDRE